MKLTIALLACLTGVGAFAPSSRSINIAKTAAAAPPTGTTLYQMGARTIGFAMDAITDEEAAIIDQQEKVTVYLSKLNAPTAVRSDLGTSVMVSGFDPREPAAMEILDFLNNEDSPHFPFTKIVAHVEDVKVAKKRLISRTSRYTGLLDKLDFTEGASFPTVEQLAGVSSWVAHVDGGDMSKLSTIVDAAEGADSVKNVVILVSGAQSVGGEALKEAEKMLADNATNFAYTLLVVPKWNDEPEATSAFGIVNVTDVVDTPFGESETFSREESLRIISECLAIEKATGKCVVANAAKDAKSLENMLIVGMRELGFNRLQEVEHMVTSGAKGYNDKIDTTDENGWEKAPVRSEEEIAAFNKTKEEKVAIEKEERADAAKQREIKVIAADWAKREYLRKSLKKAIPVKEEEFIEIIWDRAMFEAGLKYRTMQGQAVNESEERQTFRDMQAAKKKEVFSGYKNLVDGLVADDFTRKSD